MSSLINAPVNFFRPERLEGEGFKTYQHRRKLGLQAAHMTRLVRNHTATKAKKMRRALVDALGIRQAKKWLRHAKAARARAVAEQLQDPTLPMVPAPVYMGPAADRAQAFTNLASAS